MFAALLLILALSVPLSDAILCKTCVSFLDESEGDLLDLVLQYGISKGCAICGDLKSKLGQEVCGILCEIVGIEAFVKVLRAEDITPSYVCAELGSCPKNECNNECTLIEDVKITPPSGPIGTRFSVAVKIHAPVKSGTGSTVLSWNCPTSGPIGVEILTEGYAANQTVTFTHVIQTQEASCLYGPGVYNMTVLSCKYACTDLKGEVYSAAKAEFQITQ